MADLVENILQAAAEKESKLKTTEVQKDIDVEIDEGNLLAIDTNPLDTKRLKSNREEFLQALTRDNTQLLLNNIWQLPIERVEDAIIAKLPDPQTRLPREKPIPVAKPLTKWQQYQKDKGFQKRKKERMVWDDEKREWRPRWGYKRVNDIKDKWMLEVPDTADPYEDQFAKLKKEKRERVAKNELQRLRNIGRNMKGKMPGVGLVPTPTPSKEQVSQALHEAKTSDASLGRFSKTLPKEKPVKNMGKKRKFEANYSSGDKEKQRSLDILNQIQNKKPKLDITQAVNAQLHKSEMQRSQSKQGKGKGPKGKQMKMQHAKAGGGGKKGKGGGKGGPKGGGKGMKGGGGGKKGGKGGKRN